MCVWPQTYPTPFSRSEAPPASQTLSPPAWSPWSWMGLNPCSQVLKSGQTPAKPEESMPLQQQINGLWLWNEKSLVQHTEPVAVLCIYKSHKRLRQASLFQTWVYVMDNTRSHAAVAGALKWMSDILIYSTGNVQRRHLIGQILTHTWKSLQTLSHL